MDRYTTAEEFGIAIAPYSSNPAAAPTMPLTLPRARKSTGGSAYKTEHAATVVSDESGRQEIYVQPFQMPGRRWLISTDGGNEPVWSRDGRRLFYVNGDKMMAVDITMHEPARFLARQMSLAGQPACYFHPEPVVPQEDVAEAGDERAAGHISLTPSR